MVQFPEPLRAAAGPVTLTLVMSTRHVRHPLSRIMATNKEEGAQYPQLSNPLCSVGGFPRQHGVRDGTNREHVPLECLRILHTSFV